MTSASLAGTPALACPVFVINMERDTARRQHMVEVLGRIGMAAEFVTAVDGRAMPASDRAAYDHARALRIYGVGMKDSEIGCFLSHYRIYERMLREGIETALVLEDDVTIQPNLPTVVADLLACPYTGWLVVRLDTKLGPVAHPVTPKFTGTPVAELPNGGTFYRLRTKVLGVGAYLIRREGAARMVAYGKRIFMPIDQAMDRYWENGIIPHAVRPFPVDQGDDFGSHSGDRSNARRQEQPLPVRMRRRLQRMEDGVRKRVFNLLH